MVIVSYWIYVIYMPMFIVSYWIYVIYMPMFIVSYWIYVIYVPLFIISYWIYDMYMPMSIWMMSICMLLSIVIYTNANGKWVTYLDRLYMHALDIWLSIFEEKILYIYCCLYSKKRDYYIWICRHIYGGVFVNPFTSTIRAIRGGGE